MSCHPQKELNTFRFSHALLLLLAVVFYAVAFFSNEWFVIKPSHYGIWSITFCDILTCQDIPTLFNDQPGWYFFVQLFNVIGFISTICSFIMLFTITSVRNLPSQLYYITTSCLVAVFSILVGLILFFASLVTENHMSPPTISWSAFLAGIACVFEITAIHISTGAISSTII